MALDSDGPGLSPDSSTKLLDDLEPIISPLRTYSDVEERQHRTHPVESWRRLNKRTGAQEPAAAASRCLPRPAGLHSAPLHSLSSLPCVLHMLGAKLCKLSFLRLRLIHGRPFWKTEGRRNKETGHFSLSHSALGSVAGSACVPPRSLFPQDSAPPPLSP